MRDRFLILDCWINRTDMDGAIARVIDRARSGDGGYICFSNVHSVVTARGDRLLRVATNESFMSMPDGKPIAVVGRWLGADGLAQVAGPDFMPEFMRRVPGARHYLFGATPHTLEALTDALQAQVSGLNIVGRHSPPFRDLTVSEEIDVIKQIAAARPDYIWVGLGAPKQERWMAKHWRGLRPAVLFGVGAAFDFHAGVKRRAPEWVQRMGMEWLHRLASEPKRLWRRYLTTNSVFMFWTMTALCQRWILRGDKNR